MNIVPLIYIIVIGLTNANGVWEDKHIKQFADFTGPEAFTDCMKELVKITVQDGVTVRCQPKYPPAKGNDA